MLSKKTALIFSILGTALMLVARYAVDLHICARTDSYCRNYADNIEHLLYIFPIVLFFSLITYSRPKQVFIAWWKFARFAIPVVIIINYIIDLGLDHNPGGWFNLDNAFDIIEISILYALFVIGSIVQIFRGSIAARTEREMRQNE